MTLFRRKTPQQRIETALAKVLEKHLSPSLPKTLDDLTVLNWQVSTVPNGELEVVITLAPARRYVPAATCGEEFTTDE